MSWLAGGQAAILWAGWVWWAVPTLEGQYRRWMLGAVAVGLGNVLLWMLLTAFLETLQPGSALLSACLWLGMMFLGNAGLGWGSERIVCDLRFPRGWLQYHCPLGVATASTLLAGATGALPL